MPIRYLKLTVRTQLSDERLEEIVKGSNDADSEGAWLYFRDYDESMEVLNIAIERGLSGWLLLSSARSRISSLPSRSASS